MSNNICIIDGHPDISEARFVHALCNEYRNGATAAGHSVSQIDIASHIFSPLKSQAEFESEPDSMVIRERNKLELANHVVLIFPLWLGSMPSATRAFFEQAARANFFLNTGNKDQKWPKKMMKGKSARVIVTMGMPAIAYKALFGSSSLKAVEKGLLGISGFKPVEHTIFGGVDSASDAKRERWVSEVRALGYQGI